MFLCIFLAGATGLGASAIFFTLIFSKEKMKMKKNLELVLLIINWVIVAIQAFTIFLYGNSIGLFIIMLLALIAQVFSVYDNRKK